MTPTRAGTGRTPVMLQQEIVERRPVWAAMSELFLDTELGVEDLDRLSRILARSPYSLRALDRILYGELVPVLWSNGTIPAGHWAGFDQAWLQEAIVRRSGRLLRWPSRLLPRGWVREPWARLRERVSVAEEDGLTRARNLL